MSKGTHAYGFTHKHTHTHIHPSKWLKARGCASHAASVQYIAINYREGQPAHRPEQEGTPGKEVASRSNAKTLQLSLLHS